MSITEHLRDAALRATDGHTSAAEAYAYLRAIDKVLQECLELVKPTAIDEVERYGQEGYAAHGLRLTVKSAAGRWSYRGVQAHAQAAAKLRLIEQLAQAATKTGGHITDDDGVVIEAATYTAGGTTLYTTAA
jgi:hypothetical protein